MKKILLVLASLLFMTALARADEVRITVVLSQQIMIVDTPEETLAFNVSTAREGYVTPTGTFQPYRMAKMHYSKKYDNAPMPNSIFFYGGYAIHATYDLKRLGTPASHGCIRLHPENAKWLYLIVSDYGMEETTIVIEE